MENKNKGITLVALIITIVVMLILVAVSVNVVIKSNLIGTAEKTVDKYNKVAEEEGNSGVIEIDGKKYASIEEYINLSSINIPGGTRVNKNTEYKAGDKTAIIPAGFTVSGINSERTIDGGLVIYDIPEGTAVDWTATTTVGTENYPTVQCNYNQFVWVPVETPYVTKAELDRIINDSNGTITTEKAALQSLVDSGKYPMAVQLANGTDYRGVLYIFSEGTNKINITVSDFSTTANYNDGSVTYKREPAKLSNNDSDYVNKTKEQKLDLQTEFNNIVKSVEKQKGFWVARYELSHTKVSGINKAESKRGQTVSSAAVLHLWYGLYETCQNVNLQSGTGMESSMIYGSQWDQIMIWMKEERNINDNTLFYILNSNNMGNYTNDWQVCGYKSDYSVKQVFDLGGNLWDYTVEASKDSERTSRGSYRGFYMSPSDRISTWPADELFYYDNIKSARFILYNA